MRSSYWSSDVCSSDLTIAQEAVVAVAGERVERHVCNDADIGDRLLDRGGRPVDQVVGNEALRAGFVAKFHFDVRKGGDRRNAEIGSLLDGLHGLVDAHPVDARHGGYRINDASADRQSTRLN